MDIDFWHQRWQNNQTGFHQSDINPYLRRYFGELAKAPGRVFVPLCGKSLDMLWLAQQGYAVLGVECSGKAVASFFSENGLPVEQTAVTLEGGGEFVRWRHHGQGAPIEIYQGDFFRMPAGVLAGCRLVFDRASLIALPQTMRRDYVKKMTTLLEAGSHTLLVTLCYDQNEMNGPPFSVDEDEVVALYEKGFELEKLASGSILDQESHFRAKGLTQLTERVYRLTKR